MWHWGCIVPRMRALMITTILSRHVILSRPKYQKQRMLPVVEVPPHSTTFEKMRLGPGGSAGSALYAGEQDPCGESNSSTVLGAELILNDLNGFGVLLFGNTTVPPPTPNFQCHPGRLADGADHDTPPTRARTAASALHSTGSEPLW